MDDGAKSNGSWWRTLPGVLTAAAATITALAGLLVALHQSGLIGGGAQQSPPPSTVQARPDPAAPSSPPPASAAKEQGGAQPSPAGMEAKAVEQSSAATREPSDGRPWSEASAVITGPDGTLTVSAESLGNCIESSKELTLNSGQSIPFEKMKSFEFVREGARTTLIVTLLGGETVKGSMNMACDLVGRNELGRVSVLYEKLKRVDFQR